MYKRSLTVAGALLLRRSTMVVMWRVSVFVLLIVVVVVSALDQHKKRKSECSDASEWKAVLDQVEIDECSIGKPCTLFRGTSKTIKLTFTTKENLGNVTADVHGIIGGMAIPYSVPEPDGCLNSGMTCPVPAGQTVHYSAQLPVQTYYPALSLKVKWELKDGEKVVVCHMIPVKIE